MEDKDTIYEIYYKRDAKHDDIGAIDPDPEDGIQLTGYPNPFKENLNIQVSSLQWNGIPDVSIYNLKSQKVKTLSPNSISNGIYNYQWNGTSESGVKLNPGIYFIVCTDGKQKDARRIILEE
jgi:flagellar hook assembly protein FlgD